MTVVTAEAISAELNAEGIKLGDIKKRAKEIKKDHELAMALWASGSHHPRLLATLILDKKFLTQELIDKLASDMLEHNESERNQLSEWLMANQLMKSKKTSALIETWQDNVSPVLRRLFWYHQARLRWTGQTPPANSAELVATLERELASAVPEVQWAMNFCAGQIGIHEADYRDRCIRLGQDTGLYKDEVVPRNCTPAYLPEFIRIEVGKRA